MGLKFIKETNTYTHTGEQMKYKLTVRRTDTIEISTNESINSKVGLNALERQLSEQSKDQIEILGWQEVSEDLVLEQAEKPEEVTNEQ